MRKLETLHNEMEPPEPSCPPSLTSEKFSVGAHAHAHATERSSVEEGGCSNNGQSIVRFRRRARSISRTAGEVTRKFEGTTERWLKSKHAGKCLRCGGKTVRVAEGEPRNNGHGTTQLVRMRPRINISGRGGMRLGRCVAACAPTKDARAANARRVRELALFERGLAAQCIPARAKGSSRAAAKVLLVSTGGWDNVTQGAEAGGGWKGVTRVSQLGARYTRLAVLVGVVREGQDKQCLRCNTR